MSDEDVSTLVVRFREEGAKAGMQSVRQEVQALTQSAGQGGLVLERFGNASDQLGTSAARAAGPARGLGQTIETVGQAGERAEGGLRHVRTAMTAVALEASGTQGPLGHLAAALLMFGEGGIAVIGAAAGLGILALAYQTLTSGIREAEEENTKLVDQRRKELEAGRPNVALLDELTQATDQLADAREKLLASHTAAETARGFGPGVNPMNPAPSNDPATRQFATEEENKRRDVVNSLTVMIADLEARIKALRQRIAADGSEAARQWGADFLKDLGNTLRTAADQGDIQGATQAFGNAIADLLAHNLPGPLRRQLQDAARTLFLQVQQQIQAATGTTELSRIQLTPFSPLDLFPRVSDQQLHPGRLLQILERQPGQFAPNLFGPDAGRLGGGPSGFGPGGRFDQGLNRFAGQQMGAAEVAADEERRNKALEHAREILQRSLTPQQLFDQGVTDLTSALQEGKITQDEYTQGLAYLHKQMAQGEKQSNQLGLAIVAAVGGAISAFSSGTPGGVLGGVGGLFGTLSSLPTLGLGGLALPGAILGVLGGFLSSSRPQRVQVSSYEAEALQQMKALYDQLGSLISLVVVNEQGQPLSNLAYGLNRMTRRDAQPRIPQGLGS